MVVCCAQHDIVWDVNSASMHAGLLSERLLEASPKATLRLHGDEAKAR